jgi:hypothetical protein
MFALDPSFIALAGIVFVAFTTEATAGFGSSIITLTVGSLLYSIPALLPIAVPLNLSLVAYIVARHRSHIAWRFLLSRVLPLMFAGAAVGYAISNAVTGPRLQLAFGAMVVVLSVVELVRLIRPGIGATTALPGPVAAAVIVAAGIIHGIYATGGPLLVYAIGRSELPKRELRSTLAAIWLCLNIGLVTAFAIGGRIGRTELEAVGMLLPVVIAAIALGELLHDRIPERPFRILVFALLLCAGTMILV